jgi:hypothetical protein
MTIERWGAFSVIDHQDPKKLAADVLLYDRLLMPTPPDWDRHRWVTNNWDPDGMDKRVRQLGELAVKATWDQERQKDWQQKMDILGAELKSGFAGTAGVLADHARDYRPPGVTAIEALSAYQSEADFRELDPGASARDQAREDAAQLNCLVAHAILIPDDEDGEESLKRAIDLAGKDKFVKRRERFHEWQRSVLVTGTPPRDAADALPKLVSDYNEAVKSSGQSYRVETGILLVALGVAALATTAAVLPGAVAAVGIGPLVGAQVVSIGTAATNGILQIVRHVRGQREPDDATRKDLRGAMFHQLEQEIGWKLRPNA